MHLHGPGTDGKVRVGVTAALWAKMRHVLRVLMILAACWPNTVVAASPCVLTSKDYADIGKLNPPISKDEKGNLVRGGEVLSAEVVADLCQTRRFYELVLSREAENRLLTADEFAGSDYVAAFLTNDERKLVAKHMAAVVTQLQRN